MPKDPLRIFKGATRPNFFMPVPSDYGEDRRNSVASNTLKK